MAAQPSLPRLVRDNQLSLIIDNNLIGLGREHCNCGVEPLRAAGYVINFSRSSPILIGVRWSLKS